MEDKYLPKVLERLLSPSSNILDIGCHIGSFLSLAGGIARQGNHVAVEASPTKAQWLVKKFPNVRVEQVAISDQVGSATFEENIRRPGYSRLQGSNPSTDPVVRYDVDVTTLDNLAIPHRVDFVKIDIEGAELAAFRGGAKFIEANRPPIIFECGADDNIGLDRMGLFHHVTQKMGYNVFTFGDYLYTKGPLSADEFRKCGMYPYRAFNFVALPQ